MRPGGRPGSRSSASSTPGTYASRENASCRIVSSWPSPASSTSWCATRPGRRIEWIADRLPSLPRSRGRSRGRVLLRFVVGLDDLRSWKVSGGLRGESHHQHRAESEVRRDRRRADLPLLPSPPRRQDPLRSSRRRSARLRRSPLRRWRRRPPGREIDHRVRRTRARRRPRGQPPLAQGQGRTPTFPARPFSKTFMPRLGRAGPD